MEINMLQALSNFKSNSVEVKGNGTEGDFLKSLNNLINSEEFNGEENIEAENIPNVKVDIEDLLNIEFNEDIKTAENIIVNEEVKSDKNIEIKDVIQSYEKDELIEFVEDDKEDELNKIDENLIILANRIFNNISYKEKQQFNITEDNADFKNNTQMDMNIVNNNVNKQQEIVDNLIAFVESSSNKDNIQNKIDFVKKTFDFNEVKSKLTDLVESNFNLQNSKDEFSNNVEKSLDFASELEAISNFKVLSMKDNIKVNDSKNEINFLNNIAMTNNNANLEVKTENLEPHVVRSEYIANDIVESINYLKVNNLEEIKVKMNPKDLGELHIKIIKENNVEKVFITLHNSESFKLVKDNVAEIKNHLNNLDINVNEVNVEMKSENRDDFSQNLNQQFNKGNNKQQRRAVKFEIENESSIENDLLKTDSNINRLIEEEDMEINTRSASNSAIGKTENGTYIYDSATKTDKNLFLKMLVAQMTNQDPFNSQDPSEYISQLAQFNTLEQMMSLNDSMSYLVNLGNSMLVNNAVDAASSTIGKNVEVSVANEKGDYENFNGKVKSASIKDGVVYLELELKDTGEIKEVPYSSLTKITE